MEDYRVSSRAAQQIVSRLLDENDRVTMNLFELILSAPEAMAWSDQHSFLICQSNARTPVWAWLSPGIHADAANEAAEILAVRIRENPGIHLNMTAFPGEAVLRLAAKKAGRSIKKVMDMNAYVCRHVQEPPYRGSLAAPAAPDRPAMASLLQQLAEDGDHQIISQEEADGFASAMVGSQCLSLWRDGSEVCAMAMIAHRTDAAARINTVVTSREKRGHGYAGMLVAQLCTNLLRQGIIPMLYADAANPSSNRAYQKIGFEKTGEVTEYSIQ